MNYKKITIIFTLTFVISALLYDGWVIMMGGTEASISSLVIIMSHKHPLIPFLCGVLSGHLWWRMSPNADTKRELGE
jgi:hypothetical protein